jgi:hypothetical protein
MSQTLPIMGIALAVCQFAPAQPLRLTGSNVGFHVPAKQLFG